MSEFNVQLVGRCTSYTKRRMTHLELLFEWNAVDTTCACTCEAGQGAIAEQHVLHSAVPVQGSRMRLQDASAV